jgi:ankyrin repeat protein
MSASYYSKLDIVEYLISKGANIEAKNDNIFYHSIIFMEILL